MLAASASELAAKQHCFESNFVKKTRIINNGKNAQQKVSFVGFKKVMFKAKKNNSVYTLACDRLSATPTI